MPIDPMTGMMIASFAQPLVSAGISAAFPKKKKKIKLEEPPEVVADSQRLAGFMNTGRWGDFQAGEGYTGDLGYFEPSDLETQATGRLGSFLNASNPASFTR